MQVKQLIDVLKRFDPEADVRLSVSMPGRVIATHENIWVADYGGGPQINAALDFRQFHVYVGCGIEQFVRRIPEHEFEPAPPEDWQEPAVDLGQYDDEETAAKVRDFYAVHQGLNMPLSFPDFDYENWIPPRTRSGEYNEHIARILREKLMEE